MLEKYPKTNLFVIHEGLWSWAKYQASLQGYNSVSKYVFKLIKAEKDAIRGEVYEVKDEEGSYLAIGEPEITQRDGAHFPIIDLFKPYVGKRVRVVIEETTEINSF